MHFALESIHLQKSQYIILHILCICRSQSQPVTAHGIPYIRRSQIQYYTLCMWFFTATYHRSNNIKLYTVHYIQIHYILHCTWNSVYLQITELMQYFMHCSLNSIHLQMQNIRCEWDSIYLQVTKVMLYSLHCAWYIPADDSTTTFFYRLCLLFILVQTPATAGRIHCLAVTELSTRST